MELIIGLFDFLSLSTCHQFCMLNVNYWITHLILSTTKKGEN